jgi:ribosomal protein S18 acetylase RimI-like enzyme
MPVRPFRKDDAHALGALSADCLRSETDFVLNPLWETEEDLFAEFERLGTDPGEHVLVVEAGDGTASGVSGLLRAPKATLAGLLCPIVDSRERGRGYRGELLRATLERGAELGIKLVVAGVGTRNRSAFALLAGCGFRPVRQHFFMRCDEPPADVDPPASGLRFERADAADAAAIHALYEACGFEPRTPAATRAALEDERHAHAVARHGDRVLAFAEIATHWPRRVWVSFVGVAPDLRTKGLGSALVAWALRRQWAEGAQQALLTLSPANRTAFRAYEKVGFRRHRTFDVLERGL